MVACQQENITFLGERDKPIANKGLWGQPAWVDEPFGHRLKRLREMFGLSQDEWAAKSSVSQQTISDLENDKRNRAQTSTRKALADALPITLTQFDAFVLRGEDFSVQLDAGSGQVIVAPRKRLATPPGKIPLVGRVAASNGEHTDAVNIVGGDGTWSDAWVDQGTRAGPNAIALEVKGDSMAPRFNVGDVVIADPDASITDNCIVVVQMNGGSADMNTVKRLMILPDGRYKLSCDNHARPPMVVDRSAVAWIGRVVERREGVA